MEEKKGDLLPLSRIPMRRVGMQSGHAAPGGAKGGFKNPHYRDESRFLICWACAQGFRAV